MKNHRINLRKAYLMLAAVLVLLLVAVSCSQGPVETPKTTSPTSAAPTTAKPAASPTPSTPAATKAAFNLKYAEFSALGGSRTDALKWWGEELEKRTNGRIHIEFFWAGGLFNASDVTNAIKTGAVDMGTTPGYYPEAFPTTEAFNLPMLTNSAVAMAAAEYEMYQTIPEMRDDYEKRYNMKALAFAPTASNQLMTKKPVKTLADLKGMRIRSFGQFPALMTAIGASPVTMSASEVWDGLDKGVVDGVHWGTDNFLRYKLYEITKNYTEANLGVGDGMALAINMDAWNKLPADIQKAMQDLTPAYHEKIAEFTKRDVDKAKQAFAAANVQTYTLSDADHQVISSNVQTVWDNWAKKITDLRGISGTEFINKMVELIKKYEKQYGA